MYSLLTALRKIERLFSAMAYLTAAAGTIWLLLGHVPATAEPSFPVFCEGIDCLNADVENARALVTGRFSVSQDNLCQMGNPLENQQQIFDRVQAFCHNQFFPYGDSRGTFDEITYADKRLVNYFRGGRSPKEQDEGNRAFEAVREARKMPLNELLENVARTYAVWAVQHPLIRLEWVNTITNRTSIDTADLGDLKNGANLLTSSTEIGSNSFHKIKVAPLFGSFIDVPGGSDNLWFGIAHEFGHALTQFGSEFDDATLLLAVGSKNSLRTCLPYLYAFNPMQLINESTRAESTADFLATNALAQSIPKDLSPSQAKDIVVQKTQSMCAMFIAKGAREFSVRGSSDVHSNGYPWIWNRINAIFSNNSIRKKLGCEKFTGPQYECHN